MCTQKKVCILCIIYTMYTIQHVHMLQSIKNSLSVVLLEANLKKPEFGINKKKKSAKRSKFASKFAWVRRGKNNRTRWNNRTRFLLLWNLGLELLN